MNDNADDPYWNWTEEELAELGEHWWDCYLINPIKQHDLPAIQRYLARNPELPTDIPYDYDPFILAARQPDPAALRLLLDYWAVHPTPDEPPPNERGISLLNAACSRGALETARYLLDEQPVLSGLHDRSTYDRTPILEAADSFVMLAKDKERTEGTCEKIHRSEALMNFLLDRGANAADSADSWHHGDRDTVLSLAISCAGPALLRRLLDQGADVLTTTSDHSHHLYGFLFENTKTSDNLTVLHLAAFYGNYPGIQVLMEHYAQRGLDWTDALASQDNFGRLPIHYAAAGWPGRNYDSSDRDTHADTISLLRILTDAGNPRFVNAPDKYGETPLHYAVSPNLITYSAAISVARFLCTDLHASARLRGRDGGTPLHRLCYGHPSDTSSSIDTGLAALFLDLDQDFAADINAVDDAGNTPLHLAARRIADVPAARFLLSRGADVRVRNKQGCTPLHEAARGPFNKWKGSVDYFSSNRPQDTMLAVLCGSTEEGLVLEENRNAWMDEEDVDGKTPRQIAEETRAAWREEAVKWARLRTRGRGRGRGRGVGRGTGSGRGG